MERKYSFEAGLNVFTSYKTIIPVEDFSILKKIDPHRYHIYGILSYNQFFKKNRIFSLKSRDFYHLHYLF